MHLTLSKNALGQSHLPVVQILGPNVAVVRLAFLFRIQEIPRSYLGHDTDSPDRVFLVFLGPSRKMPG
jgi:hypothetical protein